MYIRLFLTALSIAGFMRQGLSQRLDVYILDGIYDTNIISGRNYRYYEFMGYAYIDPLMKDTIDYGKVAEGINRLYPNHSSSGFLSVDIENQIYNNLKSNNRKERQQSVNEFIKLIRFIKEQRPDVKVGIYGIPFRFNYAFQKEQNYFDDLRPLLECVDYLSPDIYFSFSEKQQSPEAYSSSLNENLHLFLEYARKVNKPVYPYVWYKIHPYNKTYGGEIISKERMLLLLNRLENFSYNGKKVDGILWWEAWSKGSDAEVAKKTNILIEYTQSINK